MSELSDADLYNMGLAVYNSLNNSATEPEFFMTTDEEQRFRDQCNTNKNFRNDLFRSVKSAEREFEYALSINENDYSNANDFFHAKKDAEEEVLKKFKS